MLQGHLDDWLKKFVLLEYSRPSDRFLFSQADNIELARDIQNLALGFIEFCRKRIQNVFGFCLSLQLKLSKFSFAFFRFDERELSVFFALASLSSNERSNGSLTE